MGEYASYELSKEMSQGLPFNPHYAPKKRPRCSCVICGREVEASEGLDAHIKSKHHPER